MNDVIKTIRNKSLLHFSAFADLHNHHLNIWKHRELIAALFSGALILTAWLWDSTFSEGTTIVFLITAFLIGGYAKAKEGLTETIQEKSLNVELLMIIAAIGAASIGYWTEGAVLIFIFALSGALETYTENKNTKELESLIHLQPETAFLLSGQEIAVADLQIDDQIMIRAGERIPADGKIYRGETEIDESAITGESVPVTKSVNDSVYAGTVNVNGTLYVEIDTLPNETLFQRIIKLVQNAQSEKSPSQLFIERFESTYVKVVLLVVAIMMVLPHFVFGWSWTDTVYRAMILLVVASPCALVASIMPATLAAISTSARNGVLFKGGVYAEGLASIDTVAFDKTGTLTEGKPFVTDWYMADHFNEQDVATFVYAIEKESTHPLANAMTSWGRSLKNDGYVPEIDRVQHQNGKGLIANIGQDQWTIGNTKLVKEANANTFMNMHHINNQNGHTTIYVQKNDEIIAVFFLKDTLRKESVEAIATLNELGIQTVMLTGDNEQTAKIIAQEANIQSFHANCLPEDKVAQLKALSARNRNVAMIGDGINDAPALAAANLGIAMGAGSDIALETSDIVLVKNNLSKIVDAIQLSKKMNQIIKQNIVFSIGIILALIASNFLQIIDMPLGVIGHEGSTILVILNGLRLLGK
ncbi:cadmium-translocating P-type ATPase [Gracilibacillus caseinilyticus]|uniref:Cadmium-translocating P-type ATPase n=1 Tax=Gracilibacillus caseinilyticus TaxID=2932256 RepID=A0ABY4EX64_9BACI|nr:heavy metal translocating P-type ATPase [Gracilibacillus caseinilyticus]UOQ48870.1 cadmium-translocating P-type ATPase [Gracilibacillus caseinilyticus]